MSLAQLYQLYGWEGAFGKWWSHKYLHLHGKLLVLRMLICTLFRGGGVKKYMVGTFVQMLIF